MNTLLNGLIRGTTLGLAASLIVACGSPDNNALPSDDRSTKQFVGISGDVNGQSYHYVGDSRYTYAGDKRSIAAEDLNDHLQSWKITAIDHAVGNYSCDQTTAISLVLSGQPYLAQACQINVTAVNNNMLEGTFSGLLTGLGEISNGEFRILLDEAIGDLDQDGIADADDNCPYDSNPEQLNGNNNRLGDACDPQA